MHTQKEKEEAHTEKEKYTEEINKNEPKAKQSKSNK